VMRDAAPLSRRILHTTRFVPAPISSLLKACTLERASMISAGVCDSTLV
jgi:hypothetical protein